MPSGGGALFLEMCLLQQFNVRNLLPGILMNPIEHKVRAEII